jgi:hypothetical protein
MKKVGSFGLAVLATTVGLAIGVPSVKFAARGNVGVAIERVGPFTFATSVKVGVTGRAAAGEAKCFSLSAVASSLGSSDTTIIAEQELCLSGHESQRITLSGTSHLTPGEYQLTLVAGGEGNADIELLARTFTVTSNGLLKFTDSAA